MNFLSIIQTLESLLLEFILLVLFLPKTFFRVLLHPGWVSDYLNTELVREEQLRFNDYSSPMAMFLFLGAVPIFVFYAYSSGETLTIPFLQGSNTYILSTTEFFVITSLLLLIGPLYMSLLTLFVKRMPFNKSTLRRIIQMQAYLWAIPYFTYSCATIAAIIHCQDIVFCLPIEQTLLITLFGIIWLFIAEIALLKKETDKNLSQSSAIVIPALILYFIMFFLTGNVIEASLR